jgi:G:T/U-mismatch repair DNA glycosylase
MLPEIWIPNLKAILVGTCIGEESDGLGFYYLGRNNAFWDLLEYAGLTPPKFFPKAERQTLRDARATGQLSEQLSQLFFEKKENGLLRLGIGLTDLNRRIVVSNDEDPKAKPTQGDIQQFVKKVEKLKPKALGFVTNPDIFEDSFKPLYPQVTRIRGQQDFKIHGSHVWLLGSTSGRVKDADAREDVFEQFATFLSELEGN